MLLAVGIPLQVPDFEADELQVRRAEVDASIEVWSGVGRHAGFRLDENWLSRCAGHSHLERQSCYPIPAARVSSGREQDSVARLGAARLGIQHGGKIARVRF